MYLYLIAFGCLCTGDAVLDGVDSNNPTASTTGAGQSAAYMPGGCYTIREWTKDGEFWTFDPSTNKYYDLKK